MTCLRHIFDVRNTLIDAHRIGHRMLKQLSTLLGDWRIDATVGLAWMLKYVVICNSYRHHAERTYSGKYLINLRKWGHLVLDT